VPLFFYFLHLYIALRCFVFQRASPRYTILDRKDCITSSLSTSLDPAWKIYLICVDANSQSRPFAWQHAKWYEFCSHFFCILFSLIRQLSRVQTIHEKNLIYRDIKPDNFLIGRPNTKGANSSFFHAHYLSPLSRHPRFQLSMS
jgi:serine/threonine protein kinase